MTTTELREETGVKRTRLDDDDDVEITGEVTKKPFIVQSISDSEDEEDIYEAQRRKKNDRYYSKEADEDRISKEEADELDEEESDFESDSYSEDSVYEQYDRVRGDGSYGNGRDEEEETYQDDEDENDEDREDEDDGDNV